MHREFGDLAKCLPSATCSGLRAQKAEDLEDDAERL